MHPFQHLHEDRHHFLFPDRSIRHDREIQILRKTIGLQIAFLQAGPSLEDPLVPERCIGPNTPEQPTEYIILLHHILA